jgi:hypothetical protein
VGPELAVHVVAKYDHDFFSPLLLAIFNFLTLAFVNVEVVGSITCELGVLEPWLQLKWLH